MGTIILGIILLYICYVIKNFWWIVIGAIAILVLTKVFENQELQGMVRAELIEEKAVKKTQAVNTGYSFGWRGGYRSHYRYKDVVDHYECYFKVVYEDGRTKTIKCRKDSSMYRKLINK